MKAIEFKEVNLRIAENQEEYETLPVYANVNEPGLPVTACFELTEEEVEQVKKEGKIYLTFLTFGKQFQPIQMSCLKPENLSNE